MINVLGGGPQFGGARLFLQIKGDFEIVDSGTK